MSYTPRYVKELPLEGLTHRILRNPAYGGPASGIHGWPIQKHAYVGIKPEFMEALRESIRVEGFRNPIIVYASGEQDFLSFGGSRVHCGRDIGLSSIPAIVNDYGGRYEDCPEVTMDNYRGLFTDVPKYFIIDDKGADYHYNLERKRRKDYDSAGFNWAEEGAEFLALNFPWLEEDYDPSPNSAQRLRW